MFSFINHTKIPLLSRVDVLVTGAGSAGCIASLAAATSKTNRVMLIERYGFPGGTSTQMLDTFYGFFTPGASPKKIIGGFPDEVVNQLNIQKAIFLRPNTYGAGTGVNYNPEKLKWVWDVMLAKAGVNTLLHTILVDVAGIGEINTCIVWNKGGFFRIEAKRVIDASGDADFCKLAGLDYELAGENEPAQSMTTTFRMSNVDLEEYERAGGKKMLMQKMNDAVASGKHLLPRKEGSAHEMNARNCISTVAVKVAGYNALDAAELTKAETEGRNQAFIYEKFFQEEVPGFSNADIIGLSHQIGIRETRRVYGKYRLTREDCMKATIPADSIFLCGAPIEDHRQGTGGESETYWQYIPGNGVYGVPYGTIVPQKTNTCWVAGRCFSATHDAHASCRSMAQTMSMGQAAGFAVIQSLEKDVSAGEVDINKLQNRIIDAGGVLELPGRTADISRNGWKNNF